MGVGRDDPQVLAERVPRGKVDEPGLAVCLTGGGRGGKADRGRDLEGRLGRADARGQGKQDERGEAEEELTRLLDGDTTGSQG